MEDRRRDPISIWEQFRSGPQAGSFRTWPEFLTDCFWQLYEPQAERQGTLTERDAYISILKVGESRLRTEDFWLRLDCLWGQNDAVGHAVNIPEVERAGMLVVGLKSDQFCRCQTAPTERPFANDPRHVLAG